MSEKIESRIFFRLQNKFVLKNLQVRKFNVTGAQRPLMHLARIQVNPEEVHGYLLLAA